MFTLCVCISAYMLVCVLVYVVDVCLVPGTHGGQKRGHLILCNWSDRL